MLKLLRFINRISDAWVRLLGASWPAKNEVGLRFSIDAGRNGRSIATWQMDVSGIREYHITDANGGGMAISRTDHPVVRQYVDSQDALHFQGSIEDPDRAIGALWASHVGAVDDWIDPDRYLPSPSALLAPAPLRGVRYRPRSTTPFTNCRRARCLKNGARPRRPISFSPSRPAASLLT